MKKKVFLLLACSIPVLLSSNLFAQADQMEQDIEGSKDCALLTRFPGAIIEFYQENRFDKYSLIVSKAEWNEERETNIATTFDIEGKVIRMQYTVPRENNAYLLYKTYLNALAEANHEILFKGYQSDELGLSSTDFFYYYYGEVNPVDPTITPYGAKYGYIASKYVEADKTTFLAICVIENPDDWNFSLVNIDAIEIEPMETGLVSAKMMADNISVKGHVSIYGIHFDTGKINIKPESENALKEIADFLKSHPTNKYFIVGHTDNVGDFGSNMILSENRAKEVVKHLVSDFGVDPAQIEAHGVSSLTPVTSNLSDYGKARNRRVEIVEQ
jgi:flagellar motor protein MotB